MPTEHSHIWSLGDRRHPTRCVECGRPLRPLWSRLRERVLMWWAER